MTQRITILLDEQDLLDILSNGTSALLRDKLHAALKVIGSPVLGELILTATRVQEE